MPRLYAILDLDLAVARGLAPLDIIDAWLDAGVRLIQVRGKSCATGVLVSLTEAVVTRARRAGATVVVNDRADVARLTDADGVHLGQNDLDVEAARRLLGPRATIGLSTHGTDQARLACAQPVSYVAIGPIFDTATKGPSVDPTVGLGGLRAASHHVRAAGLPLVAIGGITLERVPDVLAAGATSVAVIADLLVGAPVDRARHYLRTLADCAI